MKVKVISQNPLDEQRPRQQDLHRQRRNMDPLLHPFERAREYTRALNATKLDRLLAKPFLGALEGHADGVYALAKDPNRLSSVCSGSADGELRLWDLSDRTTRWRVQAHRGFVRGVCFCPVAGAGKGRLASVGDDKLIKVWKSTEERQSDRMDGEERFQVGGDSILTLKSQQLMNAVDHHRSKSYIATAGSRIDLWDTERSEPLTSWSWDADTINTVRFNPTEVSVLASSGTDRTLILYDIRFNSPLSRLVLRMKANALSWNPMEAFNFTVANEDHHLYTFDMRNLKSALNVYKDHMAAVLDVDYSPTGQELVSGSYDQTLRIFNVNEGHSRDVYHTKRMQRVFGVRFSMDGKYIVSASDDGSLRLWKSKASEKVEAIGMRERAAEEYKKHLKEKFKAVPELKRIRDHRRVPKAIKSAQKKKRVMEEAQVRRKENEKKHARDPSEVKFTADRKKAVVTVQA